MEFTKTQMAKMFKRHIKGAKQVARVLNGRFFGNGVDGTAVSRQNLALLESPTPPRRWVSANQAVVVELSAPSQWETVLMDGVSAHCYYRGSSYEAAAAIYEQLVAEQ